MVGGIFQDCLKFLLRQRAERRNVAQFLQLIHQHDQRYFIFFVQQFLITVFPQRNKVILEVGNIFGERRSLGDAASEIKRYCPFLASFIVYNGQNGRISEILLLGDAFLSLFLFLFIRFPDIDHIAEYLHSHIILHFSLMFNKRNKKKRCTIFNMDFLDPVRVALFGKKRYIFFRYILDVLGADIFQAGDAIDIISQELGTQDRLVKDELAAAVRQFGV